jgi:hypothetical protein
VGLIIGVVVGLIIGVVTGLIVSLISGMKQDLEMRYRPNQGIWKSLQSQIKITMIIFIMTTFVERHRVGFYHSLLIGFVVGGGKAVLQHIALRIVLWQSGLPWNFKQFLNYCVERRLILRVGGSYRFLHNELLDHFARSSR